MERPLRTDSSVWRGRDIESDEHAGGDQHWVVRLTPNMVDELARLVGSSADLELPFEREDFAFDACAAVVDEVIELLSSGPGVALVRGLPRAVHRRPM